MISLPLNKALFATNAGIKKGIPVVGQVFADALNVVATIEGAGNNPTRPDVGFF